MTISSFYLLRISFFTFEYNFVWYLFFFITVDWSSKFRREDLSSVLPAQSSPPQHTMRHREPHILPTFSNAASDMDNLDDVR